MPTVRLEGIAQVALTVSNIDEALAFYEGKLGLRPLFKTSNLAMVTCGDTRILLGTPQESRTKQEIFLYFRVADIENACASLRSSGIRVDQDPHRVGSFQGLDTWLATFFDPAGTLHHLISEVPSAADP